MIEQADDSFRTQAGRSHRIGKVGLLLAGGVDAAEALATLDAPRETPHDARPVASGGRGSAWWVELGGRPAVLRHYRRGGWAARLLGDRYLYIGAESTRPVREFELLGAMRRRGLPVPEPLAARFERHGIFYRADLITAAIDGPTLGAVIESDQAGKEVDVPWSVIGSTLARFHQAGVQHADLNAHNILLAKDAVMLIDFDRGSMGPVRERGAARSLRRLRRSLDKLAKHHPEQLAGISAGWAELSEAYDKAYAR